MGSTSSAPGISNHARFRWLQRGTPALRVREVWEQGIHVGVDSHHGTARLHPPTQTLLLERDNEIVTVFRSDYAEYTADHLLECDQCGSHYELSAEDRTCPWCTSNTEEVANE